MNNIINLLLKSICVIALLSGCNNNYLSTQDTDDTSITSNTNSDITSGEKESSSTISSDTETSSDTDIPSVATYSVTWKNWDGSVLETDTNVAYGSTPSYDGSAPTKEGDAQYTYTFTGWSPSVDIVTGDATYIAQFSSSVNHYTIAWNVDGNITTEDYEYGATPSFKGDTSKTKDTQYTYIFTGWSPNIETVTGDTTYVAQYSSIVNHYTITWNVDGNVIREDYAYGENPTFKGSTEKSGDAQYTYSFTGWSPSITAVTQDTTYVAQYSSSLNSYTITWNVDGNITTEDYEYGATPSFKGDTSKPKDAQYIYSFTGWSPSITAVTQDTTYVAQYSDNPVQYHISYELNGGNANNPISYTVETENFVLKNPTLNGYNFVGWTGSNGDIPELEVLINCSLCVNYNFIANWELATYSITYHLFGGINNIKNPTTYTILDTITLANPTKDNYSFNGWFRDLDFSQQITSLNGLFGDLDLYAKFSPNTFVGTFVFDECDTFDSEIIMPSKNIKSYLKFDHSTSQSTGVFYLGNTTTFHMYGYMASNYYMGGGNPLCRIKNLETNNLVFDKKGTNGQINFDTNISLSGNCHYQVIIAYMPSSFYMEAVNYNNVFKRDYDFSYDNVISSPQPTKYGYDFKGWLDANNEPISNIWNYSIKQEFHAKWEIHNFAILYNLNGGINHEENPSFYNIYSEDIHLLEPSRNGYKFDGWYKDSKFVNSIETITASDYCDFNLFAKWVPLTYSLSLNYDGGQNCPTINFYSQDSILRSVDLYKDSTLSYFVPDSPNDNLKFGGWYTNSTCTKLFSFNGIVKTDLNLYAKWIDVSNDDYSELGNDVNVQINGTEYKFITIVSPFDQTIRVTSSSGLDLFGAIYDENWKLLSSCDDISSENLDFSIDFSPKPGKKYYIGYKANQALTSGDCVISITGTNSSNRYITGEYTQVIDSIMVTYDQPFTLPAPKKEGYTFIGWFDENGNLIDTSSWNYTEDIIIYAHWLTN